MTIPELVLDESLFIGAGAHRRVYRHPRDPGLCIKIEANELTYSPTAKEVRYFKKLRWIRPFYTYGQIARCHGWVATNLGRGAIYELVLDEVTGEVAPTLQAVLESIAADGPSSPWKLSDVRRAVIAFRDGLMRQAIPMRDPHFENLCVERAASGALRVVAVDSIGHRDAIPLVDVWPWFGRRKVARYLKRFGLDGEPVLDPVASRSTLRRIQVAAGYVPPRRSAEAHAPLDRRVARRMPTLS